MENRKKTHKVLSSNQYYHGLVAMMAASYKTYQQSVKDEGRAVIFSWANGYWMFLRGRQPLSSFCSYRWFHHAPFGSKSVIIQIEFIVAKQRRWTNPIQNKNNKKAWMWEDDLKRWNKLISVGESYWWNYIVIRMLIKLV